jgi:hypothetical protein
LLTLEIWMEQFIDKSVKPVVSSEIACGRLAC